MPCLPCRHIVNTKSPHHISTHPTPCRTLAPLWAAAYRLNRSLVVAATRLGAQLDGLGSAALPTTDFEQLQLEASGLGMRAASAIAVVKCGLATLEQAAVEAVSRAAAFQLVSAGVLGLDAGPLLACLLLRAGLLEEGGSIAQLFSLLMAEFAGVGRQFENQASSDAAAGIRAAFSAVVREPHLVSLMDRTRHYIELAQERGSSSASLVEVAAGSLVYGLGYLLQALPGGPGAGWTAFQELVDVEVLRQSFVPQLSAVAREVRVGGAPPPGYWLPLLHVTAAAARHAAASGVAGAKQPVEDALVVVTFFLVVDVVLEPPAVQHGLQLAIQTVGNATAALGHAVGVADKPGTGSNAEAGDGRSTSPGLGGVLRALIAAVSELASSVSTWWDSVMASGEARHESARQRAWDAAWLGQGIAEMCATAEACERLAVTLVPALLYGRMLADGLGGVEARRLAQDLARYSRTLVTRVALVAEHQRTPGQLGQEDWEGLLWLSLTSARAVHGSLALPPAQLRLFDTEDASGSPFTPCQSSLCFAYLAMDLEAAPAVELR